MYRLTADWVRRLYDRQLTTPGMTEVLRGKTIQSLINLSQQVEEKHTMANIEVDEATFQGWAASFEAVAVTLANEINTLLQNAAAAGTPIPAADTAAVTKALSDLQALSFPAGTTPASVPVPTTAPVTPPVTPPATS